MSVRVERVDALPDDDHVVITTDIDGNTTIWVLAADVSQEGADALARAFEAGRLYCQPLKHPRRDPLADAPPALLANVPN